LVERHRNPENQREVLVEATKYAKEQLVVNPPLKHIKVKEAMESILTDSERTELSRLLNKLQAGAFIHMATDWQNYAEHMLDVLQQYPQLRNTSDTNDYIPRPDFRPLTKFEQRGHRLGHGVWDLYFIKS